MNPTCHMQQFVIRKSVRADDPLQSRIILKMILRLFSLFMAADVA